MTAMGINVRPEVFSTKNMICALDAVSFLGLISCNWSIALSPIGVAALSSPNMFAQKFSIMDPLEG